MFYSEGEVFVTFQVYFFSSLLFQVLFLFHIALSICTIYIAVDSYTKY